MCAMKNAIQERPASQDAGRVKVQATQNFMQRFFDGGKDEQSVVFQQNGIWTGILLLMENSEDNDLLGKIVATTLFDSVRNFGEDVGFWFYSLGLMTAWHETLPFDVVESRISNSIGKFLSDNDVYLLQRMMEVARATYINKKEELAGESNPMQTS